MKMRMTPIVLLMTCLFACPSMAEEFTRSQQETILAEAQSLYDEATKLVRTDPEAADSSFRDSAERFQLLVDDGIVNGALYYDLGNAYFQAGDLGQAIANYLRANQLIPNDPRLDANLAHARTLVRPQVVKEGSDALLHRLTFWHHGWPIQWRLIIFGIAWVGLWIALLVRTNIRYPGFRWILGTTTAAAIAFGLSSLLTMTEHSTLERGVLIKDEVVVRKGNADSFSPQFEEPVNQGLEFRVLEQRPEWLHIELMNGQSGWIPKSDAEIISREATGNLAIS
tara:strand:- start:601 stop:1446 length:846 start_codon:yes stop_codon:yes gene_type:complete